MRRVTFHGPADLLRIGDRTVRRNVPTDVPNQFADQAKKRCGDRLTVHDPEPLDSGQEDDEQ